MLNAALPPDKVQTMTLPQGTTLVVCCDGAAPPPVVSPKGNSVHVPAWLGVFLSSHEVLAMEKPVSNPARLVTNGNSMFVMQRTTPATVRGVLVSTKRGLGSVPLDVVTVLSGAKFTLIEMEPTLGESFGVFAWKANTTGMTRFSMTNGLSSTTSYTTNPEPPVMLTSFDALRVGLNAPAPLPSVPEIFVIDSVCVEPPTVLVVP